MLSNLFDAAKKQIRVLAGPLLLGMAATVTLLVFELFAFAQTGPTEPDPVNLVTQIIAAITAGQWPLVAILATAGIVWLAEHFLPQYIPALGKPISSGLLALVMSMVLPVIEIARGTFTLATFIGAIFSGFVAWGGPTKLLALFGVNLPPAAPPAAKSAPAVAKPSFEL